MTARWSNLSVLRFSRGSDPVEAAASAAREVVVRAIDAGWSGPPFDPLALADILKIEVVPRDDVREARTVPVGREDRFRIEFNPNRPKGRLRYSIAHEISHTLFEDCADRVRHRGEHSALASDDWQLEALCNIAAAELLMPLGTLPRLDRDGLDVNRLMELRKKFDVSTEALFIRAVQVTGEPCIMFCASRMQRGSRANGFRLDYVIPSRSWRGRDFKPGLLLPETSVLSECTAIGYTAKRSESWSGRRVHVECVGIPSYPGDAHPRVVGVVTQEGAADSNRPGIVYLRGSAIDPRGDEPKIVAQVVNDKTPNWGGGGFALALRRKWPEAQRDFQAWVKASRGNLSLGMVRLLDVDDDIAVASMVAQKAYGPSAGPRIRYRALSECLRSVATEATTRGASVHMPRIGCGQGGGSWEIVEELVVTLLSSIGIAVFVYDLPGSEMPRLAPQTRLPLRA